MKNIQSYIHFSKILVVCVLLFYVIFNTPFIASISLNKESWESLWNEHDGLYKAISKTVVLAFGQAFFIIVLSIITSFLLYNIDIQSKISRYLSILIIPIILGNVSIAFLFKILILNNQWNFNSAYIKFLTLTIIQFWQFGSLFIYLFWVNQQSIPQATWDYVKASKFSDIDKIKDILLPKQFNLILLLFIVAFIFCYYETSKIEFVFKASRGTNTELVNQWLTRTYQSDTLINTQYAFNNLSNSAFYVSACAGFLFLVSMFLCKILLSRIVKNRLSITLKLLPTLKFSKLVSILLVLWVLLPIIYVFYVQRANLNLHFETLTPTLFLTGLAALISTILSIFFGVMSRLAWQDKLSSFNLYSFAFLLLLFSMILIPPVVILVLGFQWMQQVGYNSPISIQVAWVIGQVLVAFPLLSSFSIITFFKVKNEHIKYLDAHRSTFYERIKFLFILPYKADYLFTFLLAFAMIFNESTINSILSDFIGSFITELNKTTTGKAVDYSDGMSYLIISILISISCVALWNWTLYKNQEK